MVLIMNVLKSKKIVRNRGCIKDADCDTEGSIQEERTGYDSETQEEDDRGEVKIIKGTGRNSKKKRRAVGHSDSENESDFVEELVRKYKKNSVGKGKRIKVSPEVRDSSPSDNDTLG